MNMMGRRDYLKTVGMVGGTGTLAGCSFGAGGGGDIDEVTIAVSFYPLLSYTVSHQVAIAKDLDQAHGIDITDVTSFSGGGNTVRGVVTGGLLLGNSGLPAAVNGFLAGAPLSIIGVGNGTIDLEFHALPDADIDSIQDLAGKTVALSNPESVGEAALLLSVDRSDGITMDDVEMLYAGGLGEAITALNEGEADATFMVPPLNQQMVEGGNTKSIFKVYEILPDFAEGVLIMGPEIIENQPALAQAIVDTQMDAYDFILQNTEEAAQIYASNADIPENIALSELNKYKPADKFDIGLSEAKLKTAAESMILQGLIDEQPPWDEIINDQFLPEDKKADWI